MSPSTLRAMVYRVQHAKTRRIAYAAIAFVLILWCFLPQPYVARAKILPQDSSSAGLGQVLNSLGGQFSSFASLLSNGRPPNELYLIIGRTDLVNTDVIASLHLVGPDAAYRTQDAAVLDLKKKVDVHLLVGGVLEVEATTHSREQSLRLADAYVSAISRRIGALGRETIARKTKIVSDRFRDATTRVAKSSADLDSFRRQNNLASPEAQLGSELSLRANLQGRLQAKLVELSTVRQLAGPENPELKNILAEITALRAQIAGGVRPEIAATGPNVAALSGLTTRYLDLFRDYKFAQALYDVYARALEQVDVESMVAENATYIQVIEPPNLDAGRHYNVEAVALLLGLIILVFFTELYVPATGLALPGWTERS